MNVSFLCQPVNSEYLPCLVVYSRGQQMSFVLGFAGYWVLNNFKRGIYFYLMYVNAF